MRRVLLVIAWVALAALPRPTFAAIAGRVWIDANRNGQVEPGERMVEGCLVSDGRQLVRTDRDGRYAIDPQPQAANLFVVNPSGTWPVGRWWVALGPDTSAPVDFALQEQAQQGPLLFAQGTDIHLRPDMAGHYRQYVAHVNHLGLPLQFVVHTGDLVVDALGLEPPAAEKLFKLYQDETRTLRFPLREVIGNHEHVGIGRPENRDKAGPYAKGLYRSRIGPTSYALRYGPYHFIALDGSTLDARAKYGYVDRLDDDSAAWACRYLDSVGPTEPLILLMHQPRSNGESNRALLAALAGKRLLLSLCGHGHGRQESPWGGAPMIMGGAVSYAWHGFVPYPPDAWGYVVYRLDGLQVEHVFLDWAAERSFDLRQPAWPGLVDSRRLAVDGTVSDFDGNIRRVVCRLGECPVEATLSRAGHLARRFQASIDVATLAAGVYDLLIEASDGQREFTHSRPLIVTGGRATPFSAAKPATLRLRAEGPGRSATEVRFNGRPLGKLAPGKAPLAFELPADQLLRLNRVQIAPPKGQAVQVSDLQIDLDGRRLRDVRFGLTRKRPGPTAGATGAVFDYYIDVTYRGPRGAL